MSLPKDAITLCDMELTCYRRWCSAMHLDRNPILWTLVQRHSHPTCGFSLFSLVASSIIVELKGTARRHGVAVSWRVCVCLYGGHSQAVGDFQSLLADPFTAVIQHLAACETTPSAHSLSVPKYSVFPVLQHLPCYLNEPCD